MTSCQSQTKFLNRLQFVSEEETEKMMMAFQLTIDSLQNSHIQDSKVCSQGHRPLAKPKASRNGVEVVVLEIILCIRFQSILSVILLKVAKSQKDLHFASNLQKKCQFTTSSTSFQVKSAHGCDLAPFFGDWSQSEHFSKIFRECREKKYFSK